MKSPTTTANPVTVTETYHVQTTAKAEDLTILDLTGTLGRYCVQVSDVLYVYVDADGLRTLQAQIGAVLS